jgi:hypothetical protein
MAKSRRGVAICLIHPVRERLGSLVMSKPKRPPGAGHGAGVTQLPVESGWEPDLTECVEETWHFDIGRARRAGDCGIAARLPQLSIRRGMRPVCPGLAEGGGVRGAVAGSLA